MIDGSKFSIKNVLKVWNKENKTGVVLGFYYVHKDTEWISLNPAILNDKIFPIEFLCYILSHEFMHMLLYHEQGEDACYGFDLLKSEDNHTDCGGL